MASPNDLSTETIAKVVSHELGHTIGLPHDYYSDLYIMSPYVWPSQNAQWSWESKSWARNFFTNNYGVTVPACLENA
eukprot:CAMPEP_0198674852 /NCGR_PEP_ID=MMETSP1467-20131203/98124_1 /TAXON_ID=1462469 /ORGANISM="unid. sp., Strain CCMP2135" /LENGTH=76 /DNA_ID=CAMNT_0044411753 /DNA_START=25 /DNA_END=255 /DNA_ORIENTATION=-